MLNHCEFTIPGMKVRHLINMPTVPRVGDLINFEEFQGVVEWVRISSPKPEPGEERFFLYQIRLAEGWE